VGQGTAGKEKRGEEGGGDEAVSFVHHFFVIFFRRRVRGGKEVFAGWNRSRLKEKRKTEKNLNRLFHDTPYGMREEGLDGWPCLAVMREKEREEKRGKVFSRRFLPSASEKMESGEREKKWSTVLSVGYAFCRASSKGEKKGGAPRGPQRRLQHRIDDAERKKGKINKRKCWNHPVDCLKRFR